MSRFVLLTKADCPNCVRLKLMLDKPLKGEFNTQIQTVYQPDQPDEFAELAQRYAVAAAPALIDLNVGDVLRDTGSIGAVKAFLGR